MEIKGPPLAPSWSSLICEYVKRGNMELALTLYHQARELHPPGHTPGPTFVALLKACTSLRDLRRGREIQASISESGLIEKDPFVASAVVNMYAKCGSFLQAEQVFGSIAWKDVVSWNSLVSGFVEHDRGSEGIGCFQRMQIESILPTNVTYICGLKACGISKDVVKGSYMHARIGKEDMFENDNLIGTSLVDMYAKCGSVVKANMVFDALPVRNVFTWTALISGYADNAFGEEALETFKRMQDKGISPNTITFICSLKACGIVGALEKGRELHKDLVRKGFVLEGDILLGNSLIDMYVKCRELNSAQKVFEELACRDTVSWNILMMGYTEQGWCEQALELFGRMRLENVSADTLTYVYSLKACGHMSDTTRGIKIWSDIERIDILSSDVHVGNAAVDMFVKCGMLEKAQAVFDKLPVKDVITWNTLMAGYSDHGCSNETLSCFAQMQDKGIMPDSCTFICILSSCGCVGLREEGQKMHAEIEKIGLIEMDITVGNSVVDMYANFGLVNCAQIVFDRLPIHSIITWNTLISGYTEHGHADRALYCFEQMQHEGIFPDCVTFVCALKACGAIAAEGLGKEMHSEVARKGLLDMDITIGNTLLDMYAKCHLVTLAQEVFDKLPIHNTVTWNSLITSYAENGYGQKALVYFQHMQEQHCIPDDITLVCTLGACTSIGAIGSGQEIHSKIIQYGIWENDALVGGALLDMYAKHGMPEEAQLVLEKLHSRDAASWNALISGYVQHDGNRAALDCMERMQRMHICPDIITFALALKACGNLGANTQGQSVHMETIKMGFPEKDVVIGNNLIDMYAKCGSIEAAKEVFDKLYIRDAGSWNALLSGYDQLGDCHSVFQTFDKMISENFKPDCVTFLIILRTCNHHSLHVWGEKYFNIMKEDHGIIPTVMHHTAMIDLLGRSGRLAEMTHMVKNIPFFPDLGIWHAMLWACRRWGNIELARETFERSVWLEESTRTEVSSKQLIVETQ